MPTYSEDFVIKMEEILNNLKQFFNVEYKNEQLRSLLSIIGIKLELYLKNVIFSSKSGSDNFLTFNNELLKQSLNQKEVDILHDLRKKYNKAKHDPNYEFKLLDLIDLANRLEPVIDRLSSLTIGLSSNFLFPEDNRIYLILS